MHFKTFKVPNAGHDWAASGTLHYIGMLYKIFTFLLMVRCDESGATGESDVIKKAEYHQCLEEQKCRQSEDEKHANVGGSRYTDCFLISGSKVLEGVGSYVVVAVGPRSFHGRIMAGKSPHSRVLYDTLTCRGHSAERRN